MNLYIDCETVPSQAPDALALVRGTIRPPGTYKKPESIAAWWATEADAAADEAWRKQALDGGTLGELISIAVVDDHDREWVRCRERGGSEADLLREFFQTVEAWTTADAEAVMGRSEGFPVDDHLPVAHNAAFDLGYLWRRSTVHGVRRPAWLPGPMVRVGRDYSCTMIAWAGYGQRVSLDVLCRALGVPSPKDAGMDGSQVFDAWLEGRHSEIAAYNLRDARAVREVHHRLMGWREVTA